MQYELDDINKMRGFYALTQSDERLEEKLLNNINDLNGKKAIGFNKTRKEVLTEEFDRGALETLVSVTVEFYEKGILSDSGNLVQAYVSRQLYQRVMRDHVPSDMVPTLGLGIINVIKSCDNDIERAIDVIKNYYTCGQIVPVAETFREIEEELKEGKILYYEPRRRIAS